MQWEALVFRSVIILGELRGEPRIPIAADAGLVLLMKEYVHSFQWRVNLRWQFAICGWL